MYLIIKYIYAISKLQNRIKNEYTQSRIQHENAMEQEIQLK